MAFELSKNSEEEKWLQSASLDGKTFQLHNEPPRPLCVRLCVCVCAFDSYS